MTFQEGLVLQKLHQAQKYLDEADPTLELDAQNILNNIEKLRFLERQLQLIVDAFLDINKHFIKELNLEVPDDLQGTFIALAENRILPTEFAKKIAPVVGLRNQLVHRYEKIDNKKFISSFKKNRGDFDEYIKLINNYLEKNYQKT